MNFQEVIGIDVSKNVLDACIQTRQLTKRFNNSSKGITECIKWIEKNNLTTQTCLIIFEHTGMYSYRLAQTLGDMNLHHYIASRLEIKRSIGLTREKDDVFDAKRIALYGYRLRDEIQTTTPTKKQLNQLKSLMDLKRKLIKQRASFKATLKEQKLIFKKIELGVNFQVQQKMIHYLSKQIKKIETEIDAIINNDDELLNNYELITSIKGVGKEMANTVIIYTENFPKLDNWRKFASYSEIAPFPYQSGTSIKARNKMSHLANKKIKSLIHMCAITSILYNQEMKLFYQKRVEQCKSKMSTINVIRNKLIARIFAVVKRQTPYVDTLKFAS